MSGRCTRVGNCHRTPKTTHAKQQRFSITGPARTQRVLTDSSCVQRRFHVFPPSACTDPDNLTHPSAALTSPVSASRCCWREPASLDNLFLGPTRSAKFPMMTRQGPCRATAAYNLLRCFVSAPAFVVCPHRTFVSLCSCVTDTLTCAAHSWLSLDLGYISSF